nr:probable receptor-like protein kinase At1g49730 isoform X1 [Solanum lycopersicum]
MTLLYGQPIFLGFLIFLEMHLLSTTTAASVCPLDMAGSNYTLTASICSIKEERGKCCRYINALVAISVARYANATSNLGVNAETSQICLDKIAELFQFHGVNRNATVFCGFGTKIPVNYDCQGRTTVTQMIQSPQFSSVTKTCQVPLSGESECRKCLNAGILYLRNLVGTANNMTFSTCRDATFAALASQVDNVSAIDLARCFFGVKGLIIPPGPSPSQLSPEVSPSPPAAASPTQLSLNTPVKENHHPYHLTLVPVIGIVVTVVAVLMLFILIVLIWRKSKELEDSDATDKISSKSFTHPPKRFQEGTASIFTKYSYKGTKKATNNFSTTIGQGGFGTVYKAEFKDGSMVAVKRMNKVSEQAEDEFCREIELLARLHHRHLLALRGFCTERHESRFLMYEYMPNGSLKDQLHNPGTTPLSWRTRIQIAIDVANALEYLHFYCDPPLCHRDIKSSNILLDENFVAKVADFGLAHASKDGSICFEPVNTEIKGTPGYMDPEYVITQELTEKSDVYSYGVVLLELITGRRAIQDNKNLIEWAEIFMTSESKITELVDLNIGDSYDFDQLQTLLAIVRWCTQREGRARPSIKQVLGLLYECADPMHSGFVESMDDEDYDEIEGKGRTSRSRPHKGDGIFNNGDGRCLASSSSTSRSYCSRSFLIEASPPQSPL